MRDIYQVDDLHILTKLTTAAPTSQCTKLSVTMMPDIPILIAAARRRECNALAELSEFEQAQYRAIEEERDKRAFLVPCLARKYGVKPFWSLKFNYGWRSLNVPSVEYEGPSVETIHDEPYRSLVHPRHFTDGSKWFAIHMDNANTGESILRTQESATYFAEQGYMVTDLVLQMQFGQVYADDRGVICIDGSVNLEEIIGKNVMKRWIPPGRA